MTLYEMSQSAMELYEMFQSDEIDEQTLNDTLESFGVEEKLEDYAKIIRQFDADAAALDAEIERMEKRKKTIQNAKKRLQGNLVYYFDSVGKEKADAGLFKLSVRKAKAVNIFDLDKIPKKFFRKKITFDPDKKLIKETLESGKKVAGAEITINKSINIK